MGKVHGSLARAGKVKGQTPKVEAQEKKKQPRGRAKKRMQYNRRYVNVVTGMGGKSTTQFLAWTASKGIETPLDLNERSDGSRYTTAKVDLDNTSDILQIPISACITSDSLDGLAERLAYERKLESKSEFAPTWIEGADSGQLERRMMNDERKDLDQWALACVDSRANFLGDGRYAMTPYLDMVNHDASIQTRARIEEDKGFAGSGDILQLQSGKNYAKGSEVFISYGNLSNLDTLVDYGFVSDTNPCNVETIAVRMMGQQPFTLTVYPDGSVDAGSKATLRYNLATPEELEIFSTIEKGTG
ncbi:40S ribosomal protein S30 [Skeletonema marinoi]|uniref:40S ribosomal protein S30 n=1 Tax=Skeletonema marinoi TaxID=267567 RepID=A0AAD9DEV1_9STRA|nr:40S ribosomal protein S30 [Skeletonema marinoi]